MENVELNIYPDPTYGFVIEAFTESNTVRKCLSHVPKFVAPTLEQAFELAESKAFYDFVELWFQD